MRMKELVAGLGIGLVLAGCMTPLTPEEKRIEGVKVVAAATSADALVEATIKYDVPEVYDAVIARFSDRALFSQLIDLCKGEEWKGVDEWTSNQNYGIFKMLPISWGERDFNKEKQQARQRYRQRRSQYLEEEQYNFSRSGSMEESVAARELAFKKQLLKVVCDVSLKNPKQLTEADFALIGSELPLENRFMLSLVNANQAKVVKEVFRCVAENSFCVESGWNKRQFSFADVMDLYEKFASLMGPREKTLLLTSAARLWSELNGNADLQKRLGVIIGKERKLFAQLYFTCFRKGYGGYVCPYAMDAKCQLGKTLVLDAEACSQMYPFVRNYDKKVEEGMGDLLWNVEPSLRKWMINQVSDPTMLKPMLLQVTGFDPEDDIGITDALKKITNSKDLIEIATKAVDMNVRAMAMQHVDVQALLKAVAQESDKISRFRMYQTVLAISTKRDAKDVRDSILAEFKKEVDRITNDGLSLGKKTFVFDGFYPMMDKDDAIILLICKYPEAEIEEVETDGKGSLDDKKRVIELNGRDFAFITANSTVEALDFPAKMVFDVVDSEESDPHAWLRDFREKFELPEFTFDLERESFEVLGVHKSVTKSVYTYRHPNGWSIKYFGDATHRARGSVVGNEQNMSRTARGGNLRIQMD